MRTHIFKEREEQIEAEECVFEWPDNRSISKDNCLSKFHLTRETS